MVKRSGWGAGSLAADRKCRPLAFVRTAGQAADSPQFIPVLGKTRVRGPVGRPRTRPDAVAGGRAWAHLRRRGIKAVSFFRTATDRVTSRGAVRASTAVVGLLTPIVNTQLFLTRRWAS